MGLHSLQLEALLDYKKIEKQLDLEVAAEKDGKNWDSLSQSEKDHYIVQELFDNRIKPLYDSGKDKLTTDEQYVGKVTKGDDVKRLVYNFDREFTECKINVDNLSSKPIRGFLTILKILLIFLVILAILHSYKVIDIMRIESATAGSITLGALFFAFKDFSFSIFSGLRIYMDNLFSVGDRLRLDEFNIVGRVVNFNPSTVEIRSSDNSITKIYMHKIVASTFTNLAHRKKRGRYINLTLNIDANSIINLNSDLELRKKLNKVFLLKRYLKCKEEDIKNSKNNKTRIEFRESIEEEFYTNKQQFNADCAYILNTRDITNIGTFREYVFRYLSNHNLLDNDQYIMARQLQPSDTGVVIEIKAYTEVQFANKRDYERIYSDIVEHLIVALPEFKLSLFQGEASSGRKIKFS
jgi:miniconductance mechanosensitive channel